jgi:hypothetical protein
LTRSSGVVMTVFLRSVSATEECEGIQATISPLHFLIVLISPSSDGGQRSLTLGTDSGDRIDLDVGTARNPDPLHGRPVVYLDQNHMSTLNKALRAPQRLRDEQEWHAALQPISWGGASLRHRLHHLLHPIRAKGLAPTPRRAASTPTPSWTASSTTPCESWSCWSGTGWQGGRWSLRLARDSHNTWPLRGAFLMTCPCWAQRPASARPTLVA